MHYIFICLLYVSSVTSSLPVCNYDYEDASDLGMGSVLFRKTQKMNYQNADKYCKSKQSKLLEIDEEGGDAQMTHVSQKLRDLGMDPNDRPVTWCAGATEENTEGVWRWTWTQSGKMVGEFVWGSNEPGNGHLEHFMGFETFRNYREKPKLQIVGR